MKQILVNLTMIALATALLFHFCFMWRFGVVKIYESNYYILSGEIALMGLFILWGIYNIAELTMDKRRKGI